MKLDPTNPQAAIGYYIMLPSSGQVNVWNGTGSGASIIGGSFSGDANDPTDFKITNVVQDDNGHNWLEVDTSQVDGFGNISQDGNFTVTNPDIGYIPLFGDTSSNNNNDASVLSQVSTTSAADNAAPTTNSGTQTKDGTGGGGAGFFTKWNPFPKFKLPWGSNWHDNMKPLFTYLSYIIAALIIIYLIREYYKHKKK